MKPIKLSEILKATGGSLLAGNPEQEIKSITTDSRKLETDALFIPLKGGNFDGHDFVVKALKEGAAAALTEKDLQAPESGKALIRVRDTQRALQLLAAYYRSLFSIPVVALTGSVGKTTTKEMIASVLSQKYNTLKTEGNFNNEIGLPLTVFRLEKTHEMAVLEMGMSGFGEIERLSAIAKPDLAIITNIGMSHIELLGSQENIYRAKSEIVQNVKPEGAVLLNGDDLILKKHRAEIERRTYTAGKDPGCDFSAADVQSNAEGVQFCFRGLGHEFSVHLNIPGEHNVHNALFACAAGLLFGVEEDQIMAALEAFRPANMRMDKIEHGGFTIINDCYNAAPDSMAAALKVLGAYPGKKIAVLGDIACLGEYSYEAHCSVGARVAKEGIDELFTVGEQAKYIAQGAFEGGMDSGRIHSFDTVESLVRNLSASVERGSYILIKASRVMELEKVTEFLLRAF